MVLRDFYRRSRLGPQNGSHEGSRVPLQQKGPHRGYEKGRVHGAPRGAFRQEAEEGQVCMPLQRPYWIGPHRRLGLIGLPRNPTGHLRRGPKAQASYHGGVRPGAWAIPMTPYVEFPWLIERKVGALPIRLVEELRIQPWPKHWQRREILREHLRMVDLLADVSVEQRFTLEEPARWYGPVMMKTHKRRQQRA